MKTMKERKTKKFLLAATFMICAHLWGKTGRGDKGESVHTFIFKLKSLVFISSLKI